MCSTQIKSLPDSSKPRERLLYKGEGSLSDSDLLAIIIRTGGRGISALDLANIILKSYKSLNEFLSQDIEQIRKHKHLGITKAITIKAVYEISKRVNKTNQKFNHKIEKPSDVYHFVKEDLFGKDQEHLILISLDSRKKIISKDTVSIGSVNQTLIPTREILRKALMKNAVYMLLVHNHPSGDTSPSKEDISITSDLAIASDKVGLILLDHIIVSDSSFLSLKSLNIFDTERR